MLKKTLGIFLLLLTSDLYAINGLEEDEYLRCGEVDDLAFGSLFFLNAETGRAYQHHLWRDPVALGGFEALLGKEYSNFETFFQYLTSEALNYSFSASLEDINIGYMADPNDEFNNPLKVNYLVNRAEGQYVWTSQDEDFAGMEDGGPCTSITPVLYRDLLEDWYNLANEQEPEKLFQL